VAFSQAPPKCTSGSSTAASAHSFQAFTHTTASPPTRAACARSTSAESHASYFAGAAPCSTSPAPCRRASLSQEGTAVLINGNAGTASASEAAATSS
jgi:hypothetical protein